MKNEKLPKGSCKDFYIRKTWGIDVILFTCFGGYGRTELSAP